MKKLLIATLAVAVIAGCGKEEAKPAQPEAALPKVEVPAVPAIPDALKKDASATVEKVKVDLNAEKAKATK